MKDSFLKIIIIIIQIHVTIAVAENKYEIDLSTLNEHIESFKLIDNNSAIILGTSIFGNNWEVIGGRAIKIEIPKCNVIWYKEFNLKTGIRNIESSPEYTFIKLTAYPEYSASTTIIVDSIGKTVSQFKQKKIFLLNDQLLLSSVDPEYALGEYSTNVNSKFFIRKIIDNTVVHEMDLGGEVIDARLDDDTIRLI
ncbi:MAG: hypothetical protein GWN01_03360, partial [Nitrosopumilaceae archaeon]|nr:hypothetical protein [Nitrosopumilaceae archaeon]NIU86373.1 hypothetical protein [Nitrosopumilaceae archaeon]NIX60602.1 hypothetical protein [Nitrosopumilaceae archaeon]